MTILFLSISQAVSHISNRGLYPDLLRKFASEGHNLYIVCPAERKQNVNTNLIKYINVSILMVQTLNITKTSIIEKGLSILVIEYLYNRAINKYYSAISFDLILYATPPITFNGLVGKLKKRYGAASYLLLKDIFPQNALDLGMLSKWNPLYWYFKWRERRLYQISDIIGCMSPANVEYLKKYNKLISQRAKVEVCPNCIELFDSEIISNKEDIRTQYGLPNNKTILIYGGNLGRPQGIDFLVDVLKYNEQRSDVFFVIAGSGTDAYKLKQYIDSHKPKHVVMMQEMPRQKFDQLVSACDIGLIFLDKRFTIPNFPSRLLNYLEFKKPVLFATDRSTDVGIIAEKNGYGLWVESDGVYEFTKAMNNLVKDKDLCISMGQKGYDYLIKNYTVDVCYNTIMAHFKQHHYDQ